MLVNICRLKVKKGHFLNIVAVVVLIEFKEFFFPTNLNKFFDGKKIFNNKYKKETCLCVLPATVPVPEPPLIIVFVFYKDFHNLFLL